LGRNERSRYGEIDLLARAPDGMLVFVEVKTRTSRSFGYPEEAVDARKLEHLVSAAEAYLLEHPEMDEQGWRIDVIAIEGRPEEGPDRAGIEHFENISG
jgi:putative endonuclease